MASRKYTVAILALIIGVLLLGSLFNLRMADQIASLPVGQPAPSIAKLLWTKQAETPKAPQPIVINPLDDPLAPVVKKKDPKPPQLTATPEDDRGVYEAVPFSVILSQ